MQVTDNQVLSLVEDILKLGANRKKNIEKLDTWDELTEEQKASIQRGIAQFERGEGIPHEEVMAEFRKKYSR